MLTFRGASVSRFCTGLSRRDFLNAGALGIGGLTLAELLRCRAHAKTTGSSKAVIFVYLHGGPSHIDTYDMKPDAPAEYRGEFKPIQTNVPGFEICELMPLQAKIADKLALVRNMTFNPNFHDPVELFSGFRKPTEGTQAARPDFGSVISKLRSGAGPRELPPYVALDPTVGYKFLNGPAYVGMAHKAFVPSEKLLGLSLPHGVTLERLQDRKALLRSFDHLRRDMDDPRGEMAGVDAFTTQALEMVTGPKAREAFDITREPAAVRARYGAGDAIRLLQARRLVEAGVPVVTLTFGSRGNPGDPCVEFTWDTHRSNFKCLRVLVPPLDQAVHALITDLDDRGLLGDVAVVIGGEMGRHPKIGAGSMGTPNGRDHWVQAGCTLLAGGHFQTGQVIGRTDARAERSVGTPYTPQNLLATLYQHLGIDLETTLPDYTGRPIYLLDDSSPIKELF
jgi:uncharacterized protein (DUF1501 family)